MLLWRKNYQRVQGWESLQELTEPCCCFRVSSACVILTAAASLASRPPMMETLQSSQKTYVYPRKAVFIIRNTF